MSAGSACACVTCRMGMHSGTFKRHWTGAGLGTFPGPLKQLLCSSVRPAGRPKGSLLEAAECWSQGSPTGVKWTNY